MYMCGVLTLFLALWTLQGLCDRSLTLKAVTLASHQIEILFVFCSLLGSRRREDVCGFAADHGLVPLLARTFAGMEWDPSKVS